MKESPGTLSASARPTGKRIVSFGLAVLAAAVLFTASGCVRVAVAEAEAEPAVIPWVASRPRVVADAHPPLESHQVRGIAIHSTAGKSLTAVVLRGARDEYGAEKYVPRLIVQLDGFSAANPIGLSLEINKDLIGPNYAHITGSDNDYVADRVRPPNCYYHGSIVDYEASLAAISLCNGINGVIQFNETHRYTIRPGDTAAVTSHQARDSALPNGLSRPHVLVRDVGIPVSVTEKDGPQDNFCSRAASTSGSDVDAQIQEAAARMRRDAPVLKSVELGTAAQGLVKRGINNNKVIELMIASDYERYQVWGNQTESSVFNLVNYMSLLTSNGLLPPPYTLRVTLVGQFTATSPMWVPAGNFTTSATLSLFCQWRTARLTDPAFAGTFLARNDHGQVLTARTGNGLAWVGAVCSSTYSCSLAPGGRAGVIAGMVTAMTHEVGHNLGAAHDNDGTSSCATSSYVMNPSYCGNCQRQPSSWSNCSVADIRRNLATNGACLDTLSSPECGNGIVDPGEDCDSGNPVNGTACCSPQCRWRPGATCDDRTGPCCRGCQLLSSTIMCRVASHPTCDSPSYCTGTSSTCPASASFAAKNGLACNSTTTGAAGYCAYGACSSPTDQCTTRGWTYTRTCDGSHWNAPCRVYCQNSNMCYTAGDARGDFTPCPLTTNTTGICLSGTCAAASTQATVAGVCGNGVVEIGEQCDSGDTIVGSPCCTTTCQFRPGSTCDKSNGACCTADCQPAAAGTFCRASVSSCDVADYCLGTNATCPETTQTDGTACVNEGASGTCRTGICMLPAGTSMPTGTPAPTTGTRTSIPAGTLMPQSNGNGTDGGGNGSSATRAMLWRTTRMGGRWDTAVAVAAVLGPVGVVLMAVLVPFV
ncbi:myxococcus cysteine-rich [Allomyces macrogynus ATCC 38327]|uniref:Disintegrin and metalloproteinase domain-containing protein B n=1 Tax=Allomyces macrogynus (strain ATCC 38327) TaxID=578462 RepID=A0A0L0T685_ALLM3|nr:myxococcus cysteine-rich [Allomyces macrogynus ATCC 38327]|eukprot:KNE70308.1 myxococcus cysteine-rich [Allomyces macrogynus ATCC 38327]